MIRAYFVKAIKGIMKILLAHNMNASPPNTRT